MRHAAADVHEDFLDMGRDVGGREGAQELEEVGAHVGDGVGD